MDDAAVSNPEWCRRRGRIDTQKGAVEMGLFQGTARPAAVNIGTNVCSVKQILFTPIRPAFSIAASGWTRRLQSGQKIRSEASCRLPRVLPGSPKSV
jgi:hypothetical protein